MGLADTIRAAARSAFTAVGDLAKDVQYTKVRSVNYDPAAGTASSTNTVYSVKLIKAEYKAHEIDGQRIKAHDCQGLVSTLDLPSTPEGSPEGNADFVTFEDGSVYRVIDWSTDPADAVYILQLRK